MEAMDGAAGGRRMHGLGGGAGSLGGRSRTGELGGKTVALPGARPITLGGGSDQLLSQSLAVSSVQSIVVAWAKSNTALRTAVAYPRWWSRDAIVKHNYPRWWSKCSAVGVENVLQQGRAKNSQK